MRPPTTVTTTFPFSSHVSNGDRGEPARRRRPVGEARVIFDQPIERMLHGDERRGGLHHLTEGHRPADVLGGAEEQRDNRRESIGGVRHHRGAERLHHHRPPAVPDPLECRTETGALLGIAAEQGDAFAIFAQTRERVPVVGLRLVLALSYGDEAAGDPDHRTAGQHRVDERGDHQEPRDAEHGAADRNRRGRRRCTTAHR